MLKFIKNILKSSGTSNSFENLMNNTPPQKLIKFADWINGQKLLHFKLNEEEIRFLQKEYLNAWKNKNFDDSFLNWPSKTKYAEVNFLITTLQGNQGAFAAQDAFDYICTIYPDLKSFFEESDKC